MKVQCVCEIKEVFFSQQIQPVFIVLLSSARDDFILFFYRKFCPTNLFSLHVGSFLISNQSCIKSIGLEHYHTTMVRVQEKIF